MVSEALAAGKPVHIFRPPGLHAKLTGFLNKLEDEGFVQDMSLGYERTEAKKLDSTLKLLPKSSNVIPHQNMYEFSRNFVVNLGDERHKPLYQLGARS